MESLGYFIINELKYSKHTCCIAIRYDEFIIIKNTTSHFLPMDPSLSYSTVRQITRANFILLLPPFAKMTIKYCIKMVCSM